MRAARRLLHVLLVVLILLIGTAAATAIVSPIVFRMAERLHQASITVPRADGGGPR